MNHQQPTTGDVIPITTLSAVDVLNGRGQGVQRHPGNIKYRKMVFLNKIIYAKCPKGDKKKVSRGIVDAVRELGGRFLELDERTNIYNDIGNKKATEKTSQALREGQTKVRKDMYDDPNYDPSVVHREMSFESYFGYSLQFLHSLCNAEMAGDVGVEPPPPSPLGAPEAVPSSVAISPAASGAAQTDSSGRRASMQRQGGSRHFVASPSTISECSATTAVTGNGSNISNSAHSAPDRGDAMLMAMEQFSIAEMPSLPPVLVAHMPPPPPRPPMYQDPSVGSMRFTNASLRFTGTSMRLTDMSRMSLADTFSNDSVRHILETLRDSNESNKASGSPDDVKSGPRGSIEDVMEEIGDLVRYSEAQHMTMEEMGDMLDDVDMNALLEDDHENNTQEYKDEEVPLNDKKEIVLNSEDVFSDRLSEMRFTVEENGGEGNAHSDDSDLRLTDLSLMGASVMTFSDDIADMRSSGEGEVAI